MTREILETNGYHVIVASRGGEALRAFKNHSGPIHVLLTDVVMPEIGGKELASKLKLLQPKIKVVFMSGYTDTEEAMLDPDVVFLQKPFTPRVLVHKLREVLESSALVA